MSDINADLEAAINKYSDMLYKICFVILKNEHDTKDVLQDTFLIYYTKKPEFESEDHRKAWLIRVSQNKCREFLRFHKRHASLSLDKIDESEIITNGLNDYEKELLSMIWNMSLKLKSVVILHYIEGYSVDETADILKISSSAVKKRLQRAREQMKTDYEGGLVYEK
ncbi:MAG: RNA polymerase sigma factor [Eubacterium sp.]|nr:RNA polymerase sigma factor [Eubacterium sp.]